jgi:gamma-glutamyltranspeptidase/glutathione hydrolase
MPFGCPGGDMQVQAMLQVLLNIEQFGMDLQQAINAPRFSTWSFPNSFSPFEYLPDRLVVEDRFDEAVVEAIVGNVLTGFVEAAADPRQPASAIVG